MKKIITMLICSCLALVLGACSNNEVKPIAVTELFLDAYQKKDEENLKIYSEWKAYNIKALEIQESDYIDGVNKDLQKSVYQMMMDFDHKELSESIKDDNASVKVELIIYDFNAVTEKGIEEATKKAEEQSMVPDISDADAQAAISTIMFENMKEAKKTLKKEVTINLKKVKGSWIVSNDNADIQNILTSNIQSLQSIGL